MQRMVVGLVFALGLLALASDARPQMPQPIPNQSELARLLDAKLLAWAESFRHIQGPSSKLDKEAVFDNNPAYQDIVRLGLPAVPLMMQRVERGEWIMPLGGALHDITKVGFHSERIGQSPGEWVWYIKEYPDIRSSQGPPDSKNIWLHWWREGRRQTPERFAGLYAEWKGLKAEGKDKEAAEKYERIKDLGIDELPLIVQQVQSGDTDLMPVMSYLTDNESPATATPEQCVSWWEANKGKWTLPPPEPVKAPTP